MSKALRITIITAILSALAARAFAADPPKTKADCEKMTMKWDATKKACVKK